MRPSVCLEGGIFISNSMALLLSDADGRGARAARAGAALKYVVRSYLTCVALHSRHLLPSEVQSAKDEPACSRSQVRRTT